MEGDQVAPCGGQAVGVAGDAGELSLDDVALRATSGDREAWAHVWELLSPRIHAYLRLAGTQDPEALTSDVFVALIRRETAVTGGWEGLRSLAFSVAHARLVDHHRRSRTRGNDAAYTDAVDPRTMPSAESAALAQWGEGEVIALLDLLSEEERTVLTLRYVADLDIAQTASVVGRSSTTVSRLQARALQHLRGLLGPSPDRGDDLPKGEGAS